MDAGRRLPSQGINLFYSIYQWIDAYEQRTGHKPINLSLGNPDLVPDKIVSKCIAKFVTKNELAYTTYAETDNLHNFAEGMAILHSTLRAEQIASLGLLPTVGTKTTLALIPLACGLHVKDKKTPFSILVNTPAYDVSGRWTHEYFGASQRVWPLREDMRFDLDSLEDAITGNGQHPPDVIVVVRPGNPAGIGATKEEWEKLIELCIRYKIRLVNDAAYCAFTWGSGIPLAPVAINYKDLEWLELYSVSKSFSHPGARLGSVLGSHGFVDDLKLIRSNTDSGPVPSIMAAYGDLLANQQDTIKEGLKKIRETYRARLEKIISQFKDTGLKLVCEPEAGFFSLWKTPDQALGRDIHQYASEKKMSFQAAFNYLVIQELGIVGVHFSYERENISIPFIRYAVCTDVLDSTFQQNFQQALMIMKPKYH